jgi:hypothetical protein
MMYDGGYLSVYRYLCNDNPYREAPVTIATLPDNVVFFAAANTAFDRFTVVVAAAAVPLLVIVDDVVVVVGALISLEVTVTVNDADVDDMF